MLFIIKIDKFFKINNMILAIYNNSDYSGIYKDDLKKAFSLPGEYFVFEFERESHANNKSFKDPFNYYKNENQRENFRINDFELIDTSLNFIYQYSYTIFFTIFNHKDKSTRQIIRRGKYSYDLYKNELVFILSTLNLLAKTDSWSELNKIEEIESLKKQIIELQNELESLKKNV
jgi:hypothetical protein